jgi:hypothetical protein
MGRSLPMDELLRFPRPVVAVINGERARTARLADALRDCGYFPATFTIDEIAAGPVTVVDFVEHCAPDAVVYELQQPVSRRWIGLQFVRNLFPHCRWVLVVPRSAQVIASALAGIELVARPSTVGETVLAVQRALAN